MGSIIIGACSGDDDYDIYAGKELKTRADGMMGLSNENGGNTSDPLIRLKSECGSGGCGVWCIGYLIKASDWNSLKPLINNADRVKFGWNESAEDGGGLDANQIRNIASLCGITFNSNISYKYRLGNNPTIFTNTERVTNKVLHLDSIGRLANSIISVQSQHHWVVAKSLTVNKQRVICVNVNTYPSYDNVELSSITEAIYNE